MDESTWLLMGNAAQRKACLSPLPPLSFNTHTHMHTHTHTQTHIDTSAPVQGQLDMLSRTK